MALRVLALFLATSLLALGCGDDDTTPRRTGIVCALHGDVTDFPPGTRCDSPGDCQSGDCFCVDGTSSTGARDCYLGLCDPDHACEELCRMHGGPAACGTDGG